MLNFVYWATGGLIVALWLRDLQGARERRQLLRALELLHAAQQNAQTHVRKLSEDLVILQAILAERHLLSEGELVRARSKIIERPRRLAEERLAISAHLGDIGGARAAFVMLEEADGKVH